MLAALRRSVAAVAIGVAGFAPAAGSAAERLPDPVALDAGWRLRDTQRFRDHGEAISAPGYDAESWLSATVPGTVLTTLVDNGVYPEPLYGENNRPHRIPETLCRQPYWYRNQIEVPAAYAERRVWLTFEGINYTAQVWVNGAQVGEIRGAFTRGRFDVTDRVSPGETATIAVEIFPPPHPGIPHEQTVANGIGPNGGALAEDGPTFLCSMGWDWITGIRDRNIGLWQGVTLSATGPVDVVDPYVVTDLPLPRLDSADLTIEVTLHNLTDAEQAGTLTGSFDDVRFRQAVTLRPRESRLVRLSPETVPALRVREPRLWWPNGLGEPALHELALGFETGEVLSDLERVSFGIREYGYQVPDSENLTVSVNGVPVVCRGGNWGMDEAMKRVTRERIEAQVRLHRDANLNMIRNWVGQSTSRLLYEACDRYGIMLWDEFFQPNPFDGPDPTDLETYVANVRDKVLRFRNHPSIVLWSGRNEGDPPPVLDAAIRGIMSELDPIRLYQANSSDGRGVISHGPYNWQEPQGYYAWGNHEAFKTEIGSVSVPTLEAIQSFLPPESWGQIDDAWAQHDMGRGAQQGWRGEAPYPERIAHRYGRFRNLPDFVRKAQLANYEAYRAVYEGRFARLFDPTTAILIWMSNPAQPSFVWQLYSYDLEPHASYFAAKKANEPLHVMLDEARGHVMVVNQLPETRKGLRARTRVLSLDAAVLHERVQRLEAPGSDTVDLGEVAWPEELSGVHFVKLDLSDEAGVISENLYWRALPGSPNDLTALEELSSVELRAELARQDRDDRVVVGVTLSNPSESVALMTHLQLRRGSSGDRVLPVSYSDNYVSLLPGESRTISIEAASADLADEAPLVALDGWNVTVGESRSDTLSGPVAIALNANAQLDSMPATGLEIVGTRGGQVLK